MPYKTVFLAIECFFSVGFCIAQNFLKNRGFGGVPQIAFFRKMVTSCNACSPLLCQVLVNCFFQTWRNLFLQNFWFSIFRQTENFTILKIWNCFQVAHRGRASIAKIYIFAKKEKNPLSGFFSFFLFCGISPNSYQ